MIQLKEHMITLHDQFLPHPPVCIQSVYCCLSAPLQQSAERCVSTLLDLIQTKVNYVVQEAIVVIRDIFRKYPNKCVTSPEACRYFLLAAIGRL